MNPLQFRVVLSLLLFSATNGVGNASGQEERLVAAGESKLSSFFSHNQYIIAGATKTAEAVKPKVLKRMSELEFLEFFSLFSVTSLIIFIFFQPRKSSRRVWASSRRRVSYHPVIDVFPTIMLSETDKKASVKKTPPKKAVTKKGAKKSEKTISKVAKGVKKAALSEI